MNLKIRDGQLTMGSVFKLVAISWLCFGVVFVGGIFLLIFIIGAASGQMMVNGDMVQGRAAVMGAMAPMVLIGPMIIAIQAGLFGAFVVAGAALYRLRWPISVTAETTTPARL